MYHTTFLTIFTLLLSFTIPPKKGIKLILSMPLDRYLQTLFGVITINSDLEVLNDKRSIYRVQILSNPLIQVLPSAEGAYCGTGCCGGASGVIKTGVLISVVSKIAPRASSKVFSMTIWLS